MDPRPMKTGAKPRPMAETLPPFFIYLHSPLPSPDAHKRCSPLPFTLATELGTKRGPVAGNHRCVDPHLFFFSYPHHSPTDRKPAARFHSHSQAQAGSTPRRRRRPGTGA